MSDPSKCDDCGGEAYTGCTFCADKDVSTILCKNCAHVCGNLEIACPDCFVNLGAPV
jgi:hypothetical protein